MGGKGGLVSEPFAHQYFPAAGTPVFGERRPLLGGLVGLSIDFQREIDGGGGGLGVAPVWSF